VLTAGFSLLNPVLLRGSPVLFAVLFAMLVAVLVAISESSVAP